MKIRLFLLVALIASSSGRADLLPVTNSVVRFHTALGDMEVELFDADKPVTSANFIRYIQSGRYRNLFFHRLMTDFVLQAGGFGSPTRTSTAAFSSYNLVKTFGTITNEYGVGALLSNTYGTLAMAKTTNGPNTAASQWFFNLADNSTNLDLQNGGFTVFGRVVTGTNVLEQFRVLSLFSGVMNLTFFYSSGAEAFSDLPVRYNGFRYPAFSDLYYIDFVILRTPTKPTAIIVGPPNGLRFTNPPVTLHGLAADKVDLVRVEARVNDGPPMIATGTTNWTLDLILVPGTNFIQLVAVNRFGTESVAQTRTWFYSVPALLTVETNGLGSVTPVLNGRMIDIGRGLTLTATPGLGQVFSNWTGSVTSTAPVLRTLMGSNFVLRANFIPNPFIPVKGSYNGLFLEATNPVTHQRSGFINVSVTAQGSFSGKILGDGGTHPFHGKFALDGTGQVSVARPGKSSLNVQLQLGLGADAGRITGTVGSSGWQADLEADRVVFNVRTNPAGTFRGSYGLALPAGLASPTSPGGHGFATVQVDAGGGTKLLGSFGDGSPLAQLIPLGATGRWPFYVSLYGLKGSAVGWLQLTNPGTGLEPGGPITWTKTAVLGKYYPAGFTNHLEAIGSPFVMPARGVRVLDLTNATLTVSGGNLTSNLTATVTLATNNLVTITPAEVPGAKMTLSSTAGTFSGSFVHPATLRITLFKGILLQSRREAYGWFNGTNQAGGVLLSLP